MALSNFATAWTVNNPPYVILKWSIENFSSAQNTVMSPCFDISQTSKWNLLLNPSVVVDEDIFVIFYLRRDPRCPQPAKLMLKGEFSVHGPLNELIFDKLFEEVYDSASNNSIEFRVAKICFSVFSSRCDTSDTYLARCEMIISEEMNSSDHYRPHLEKLSNDIQSLYQNGTQTNVIIRALDDVIGAHKTVLSARSATLSARLDGTGYCISEDEKNVLLSAVLLFIYTGNPDILLTSIPLELFGQVAQIAMKWGLNELVNILTPIKMHCKTLLRYKTFLYTWQVKNFSKLLRDNTGIHSSEFCIDENSKWKLILEKSHHGASEDYGLYLTNLHPRNESHKADVEFCMYNKESRFRVSKRGEFTSRGSLRFGFSSFSNRAYVQSRVLRNDILYIDCKLKFRLDSESWIDFHAQHTDISDEDPYSLKYLKTFSRNFKSLFVSKRLCDITLVAIDGNLEAHKDILLVRSPYFASKLSENSTTNIQLCFMSNILKDVLLYMYAAEIPAISLLNCLQLFRASTFLQIVELKQICRQYILTNMNVDIVLDVIHLAQVFSDTELLNASISFVSNRSNARMILNTERWRSFNEMYVDISMRIYHNIVWEYCNHVCMR